ncbi:GNAT family N-acetyltransferase [Klenkia soli]|uniref:GNAT family N-acetyltransferase n=1 Tax=Klenkia soli TaxID=1052260 RepID=UPI0013F4F642|nr:GNAT family N-acetyltransferase [Klenkia soli]
MTPRWSRLTDADTPAWAELTEVLARHDGTDEVYGADDLREELREHGFDPAQDSWAVHDGDALVAYGQLRTSTAPTAEGWGRATLGGGVHPRWRGRGVGTELLRRMETRARTLLAARHPGRTLQLRADGGPAGSDTSALLSRHGYRPARWFVDMQLDLRTQTPPPVDDRTEVFTPHLAEATRLAHNDAFATHWGSTAQSPEQWRDFVAARSTRADDSFVVRDHDGTVLAYALTAEWVDRELYVSLVGTRQGARGQGLARAVLTSVVGAAARSGRYDVVDLGVDSENPGGAHQLYTSVGFAPVRTTAVFAKVEPPPSPVSPPDR